MAVTVPRIILTTTGRLKQWARPGERWRRRRSDAAMLSDFMALEKCLLLCLSCQRKMPHGWTGRYGYRCLHAFHTDGSCDYCKTYQSCDLYHQMEGGYYQQWNQQTTLLENARQQQIAIRDRRRIKGLD